MLRQLLLVRHESSLKSHILFLCLSPWSRSGKWKCVKHAILKLYQCLRRCARNLYLVAAEVEHIRRRICASENPVRVEQRSLHLSLKSVGQNHLEDISLEYVPLCPLNHAAIHLFVKQRLEITLHLNRLYLRHLSIEDELLHIFYISKCICISSFYIGCVSICNEDQL